MVRVLGMVCSFLWVWLCDVAIGFYVFFVGMFTAKNVYWALLLLCRLFITIAGGYILCKMWFLGWQYIPYRGGLKCVKGGCVLVKWGNNILQTALFRTTHSSEKTCWKAVFFSVFRSLCVCFYIVLGPQICVLHHFTFLEGRQLAFFHRPKIHFLCSKSAFLCCILLLNGVFFIFLLHCEVLKIVQ